MALLMMAGLACGKEADPCAEACKRVARCRQEARVGEKMLGERDLPPDERCMKRCQDQPDLWASCEQAKKNCHGLRGCYGPLR